MDAPTSSSPTSSETKRARALVRFCDAEQGLHESLRAVLLAQSTLAVAGVEADGHLGPLAHSAVADRVTRPPGARGRVAVGT